jgi:hypothetical protein
VSGSNGTLPDLDAQKTRGVSVRRQRTYDLHDHMSSSVPESSTPPRDLV